MATALNSFAQPMVKCHVRIKSEGGVQAYDGLFPTTTDAVIDAAERAGEEPCKVSVTVLKPN